MSGLNDCSWGLIQTTFCGLKGRSRSSICCCRLLAYPHKCPMSASYLAGDRELWEKLWGPTDVLKMTAAIIAADRVMRGKNWTQKRSQKDCTLYSEQQSPEDWTNMQHPASTTTSRRLVLTQRCRPAFGRLLRPPFHQETQNNSKIPPPLIWALWSSWVKEYQSLIFSLVERKRKRL